MSGFISNDIKKKSSLESRLGHSWVIDKMCGTWQLYYFIYIFLLLSLLLLLSSLGICDFSDELSVHLFHIKSHSG